MIINVYQLIIEHENVADWSHSYYIFEDKKSLKAKKANYHIHDDITTHQNVRLGWLLSRSHNEICIHIKKGNIFDKLNNDNSIINFNFNSSDGNYKVTLKYLECLYPMDYFRWCDKVLGTKNLYYINLA